MIYTDNTYSLSVICILLESLRRNNDMKQKHELLKAMEDDFAKLINSKGKDDLALNRINKNIKRMFNLDTTLRVDNNIHKEFFGMAVFPHKNVIERVVEELLLENSPNKVTNVEKIWAKNKTWVIEIDSMLLTDMDLNVNPSECVAILLHELGHVAFSNIAVNRLTTAMQYQLVKVNYKTKGILKWKRAQRILDLVVIEACSVKNYVTNPLKEEMYADYYAYEYGYGDALHAFVNKLLQVSGNSMIDRSERDMEKDVSSMAQWSILNISELEFRKTRLKGSLETQMRRTPSVFVHDVIQDIKNRFFARDDEETYKGMVRESSVSTEFKKYSIVTETYRELSDEFGRIKRIKQIDIDMIQLDAGKIRSLDDKLFLLDRIKNLLDTLDASEDMIEMNESKRVLLSKGKIQEFRTQLETIQAMVMKIKTTQYRGFYKLYPKGYEG